MTTDIIGGGTRLEVRGQHSEEKQSRKKVFQNIYQGMANVVPPPVPPPMTKNMAQLADAMEITHIFRVLSCYFQLHINLNLAK